MYFYILLGVVLNFCAFSVSSYTDIIALSFKNLFQKLLVTIVNILLTASAYVTVAGAWSNVYALLR